ncbi:Aldo/keto reductase [Mycena albidolilacea]|uniref:Aldo/keto reductase n=1 Tax=Mycena albidolilacea TaxID=1033008 RepID=A0AAD7ABU5_9AGAR|nr:Aldo/keto reductase [Mycena albidolilacea]
MSASTLDPSRRIKYGNLGNSGLKVSQIILGRMSYGSKEWGPWVLEEEAIRHIKFAYAPSSLTQSQIYSNGMSEVVLGNAIKKLQLPHAEIVVMTKVHGAVGKTPGVNSLELYLAGPDNVGYVNQHGLSRKHLFHSVQASLKRLQLDHIDVLQCHRFDYDTPVSETMQALHDVVKAGFVLLSRWVRYIGMSSCYAWQRFRLTCVTDYAITHNLTPFISMQNHYNLIHREEEHEMMPSLKHFDVRSIPWSPLARASDDFPSDVYFTLGAGNKEVVARVEKIAKKHNKTMAQVSLAWLLTKDEVTAPIVGTTSLEKLEDLLGAFDVKLSSEDIKYMEEPYKPMEILLYRGSQSCRFSVDSEAILKSILNRF